MEILTHRQGEPEWEEWRRMYIGASDAPVIMEVSPYKTPYQLFLEKKGKSSPKVNRSMIYGREKEDEIRRLYEEATDTRVYPRCAVHSEIHWMIASFDGITLAKDWIVELKAANAEDHKTAMNGAVPEKYWPQVQHQLAVSDLQAMHYVSYHQGDFVIVDVARDEEYIQRLIKAEQDFYDRMLTDETPECTEKDYEIRSDDETLELSGEFERLDVLIKGIEAQRKAVAELLKAKADGQPYKCGNVKVSIVRGASRIDTESLGKVVNLDDYRIPGKEILKIERMG